MYSGQNGHQRQMLVSKLTPAALVVFAAAPPSLLPLSLGTGNGFGLRGGCWSSSKRKRPGAESD